MANTWNLSGTTWGVGNYGQQNVTTIFPSGSSASLSLGSAVGFPSQGWGRDTWGLENWGQNAATVFLTGQSITSSVGDGTNMGVPRAGWGGNVWNKNEWGELTDNTAVLTGFELTISVGSVSGFAQQGWGRSEWNSGPYGESFNPVVTLASQVITSSVGSVTAFPESGWGRDTWNFESWGFSGVTIEVSGFTITSDLGPNGWGNASYGDNSWGMFTLNPADVVGLSGQQITSAVPPQFDIPEQVQGLSITSSVGSIALDNMLIGLSGQSSSFSVGSVLPADVVGLSGVSFTSSLGTAEANDAQIINISGLTTTSTVGSISLDDMTVGLGSQSMTISVGSIGPSDVVGLTGQQITSSVAGFGVSTGFGIQAYQDVDTGVNITYSDVAQEKIMASTFTPLGVELQATGENAGTWGDKTNTNLSLLSQLTGGFNSQSIAGGAQTTALTIVDGNTTGTAQHRIIEFTGTITGNQIVTIPTDVESFYLLRNSTSGAHTVQFKYASGSGSTVTFSATDKGDKLIVAKADDSTNPNIVEIALGLTEISEDTSPQLGGDLDTNDNNIIIDDAHGINDENGNEQIIFQTTSSAVNQIDITNAATGNGPEISATGGDTNVDLKLTPKGSGKLNLDGIK